MTACWWDLCIVLVCFWGCQQDKWNIGGRNWKSKCANLNCQDAELFAFIRKSNFSLFNKAKRRKEGCDSLFFFFQESCNSEHHVSFCYQVVLDWLLPNMEGGVVLAVPFKFTLLKWSIALVSYNAQSEEHPIVSHRDPSLLKPPCIKDEMGQGKTFSPFLAAAYWWKSVVVQEKIKLNGGTIWLPEGLSGTWMEDRTKNLEGWRKKDWKALRRRWCPEDSDWKMLHC